ncbi:MaoC family dehydratase [Vogesella oryzae]|uniref:MaoC family dehydratase n=1 Tax=Vogesella oryzae TaxID=1735285 RepID=UPI001583CCA9|nr:MaoC family dehydratase [Vogesella oryzae]
MLYFEDLTPGLSFATASITLSEQDIHAFAKQYDPQYFHIDNVRAEQSVFAGLAASGWQTSSVTMKLVVESEFGRSVANGLIGMGVDKMRWPRPTRAGDTLQACVEVLSGKRSSTRPEYGVVKLRWVTRNQHQEEVMSLESAIWVALRHP